VRLQSAYGATEIGCVNKLRPTHPQRSPEDWAYLEFSEQLCPRFVPQHDEDGTHELVVLAMEEHKPLILNCELDGQAAYATKDLMVPHPAKHGLWKTIGRLDDQIVLANGEKTNPGAMEDVISKCPHIELAAMFGRERNQTGVLLELTRKAQSSYQGRIRTQLMDEIWPYIEKANNVGPSHARLARETVMFARPELPLLRTPKGTLSRAATLKVYSKEIESMYAALEGSEPDIETSQSPPWNDKKAVEIWLKLLAERILGHQVDVKGDLFQQGLDRSPAHNSQAVAAQIDQETIFKHPTVTQISDVIVQLSSGTGRQLGSSHGDAASAMERMIKKYSCNSPSITPLEFRSHRLLSERVVLTGTTGGLGSHILAQLLANDRVERVWALNRRSSVAGKSLRQRQHEAFEEKQLDVALLDSPKLLLIESDITAEKLGLAPEIHEEIKSTSSIFVHNAWQVNFNLSLQSFEPSIRGTHNLITLALNSSQRPRFIFTSSVSVAGFATHGGSLRETAVDVSGAATSIGYGQSKLVAEKMLEAARSSGLECCIIRLGQLAGDSVAGAWALNDWVPSIIASSVSAGYLPDAAGSISWTPLDVIGKATLEIVLNQKAALPLFVHCSHPRPIKWSIAMSMFSRALQFLTGGQVLPMVPLREWNDRVRCLVSTSKEDEAGLFKSFPTAKIQSTIDEMVHANERLLTRRKGDVEDAMESIEAGGTVRLDITQGVRLSPSLKNVRSLGEQDVRRWVDYWKAHELFASHF
ncbi:hypothetical protein FRC09_003330, partial [Ceratobasidium sp. 395]